MCTGNVFVNVASFVCGLIRRKHEVSFFYRSAVTIPWSILTCAQTLTSCQLKLPHGTKQKRVMKKLKTKNGDAQKKRFGREVHGVSPEAGGLWWERFGETLEEIWETSMQLDQG